MNVSGLTLLELLVVIAVLGIAFTVTAANWSGVNRSLALVGYANEVAVATSRATTRANSSNDLHVIRFASDGVTWGTAPTTMTAQTCRSATTAPTLRAVLGRARKPAGVSTVNGWLCVTAPGLITRLDRLSTCQYKTTTVPCITVQRGTVTRRVLISANGQGIVQ